MALKMEIKIRNFSVRPGPNDGSGWTENVFSAGLQPVNMLHFDTPDSFITSKRSHIKAVRSHDNFTIIKKNTNQLLLKLEVAGELKLTRHKTVKYNNGTVKTI
ncbi:hypothetical protein OTU49_010846 [Cherax quadricarinatus]|uniref:Uncharacterized protein n=1 Tax=Cherax quadricarinatus TaxID=27406 RepID=A0AAW0YJE4_CHEQU